jgi:hypothetical protein
MIKMLAVVATLFLAASASAQAKSAAEHQEFVRVSGICQDSVNDQRGRGRGVFGSNNFKARVEADGSVVLVGTDPAVYEYEKCMASQGHTVRSTKR